ncbi:MAG TPA: cobyrinate a,c-diamide synthase, partial [Thermodesulfobacteriota bacterium]|nr:cobyrinate a,c-diamide synthase [Thermodesulfobacteriota bacterium]
MRQERPRIVIAALGGGGGKTTLSLGLISFWRKRGREIAPFKKGPDYIDSAWLSLAAGRPARNLDTFLMGREKARAAFLRNAPDSGISVVEGNRGLYDGVDAEGSHSTAELAKLLDAPVLLLVNVDKMTRTAAALVLGCQTLDPELKIRGVILNRVARSRQERILREAVEKSCGIPVLGAVPRLENYPFPERHLGLLPPQEHDWVENALEEACRAAEAYIDLDRVESVALGAGPLDFEAMEPEESSFPALCGRPVIGILKDSAFQFYYPENLDALSQRGADLLEISAISAEELPPVDALYIGGGFPESHAALLAENSRFRFSLRSAVEAGLPVYAECGGLMYLGENLIVAGEEFPMAGVFPVSFAMEKKPQGHGYTIVKVEKENPFFPEGAL